MTKMCPSKSVHLVLKIRCRCRKNTRNPHEIVKHQQRIGSEGSIVAEGRDLTTIVFPDADFKFYLDASVRERAKRRLSQLRKQDVNTTLESVEAEIKERDKKDTTRAHSPLRAELTQLSRYH